jgi:hypothetical protein
MAKAVYDFPVPLSIKIVHPGTHHILADPMATPPAPTVGKRKLTEHYPTTGVFVDCTKEQFPALDLAVAAPLSWNDVSSVTIPL